MPIAAATPLARMGEIPFEFWWKLAVGLLVIVVAVMLLRRLAQVNKVVLGVVVSVFVTVIGFSWIYERNEPSWATPGVGFLADFFPTKGKVTHR